MTRPMRTEVSGAVNYTDSSQLISMTYSPSGAEIGPGLLNNEDYVYNTPFLVHWYETTLVTNFMGAIWQSYGDSEDAGNLDQWSPTNEEFFSGLRKYRIFGPDKPLRFTYSSSWNKKHSKWNRPPLKFGTPNAGGNYLSINLTNQQVDTADKEYFAITKFRFHKLD